MCNSGRRASVRCPPPGHHQKKEPAVRRSAIALRTPADAFVANLATKCGAAAARSPDPVPKAALTAGPSRGHTPAWRCPRPTFQEQAAEAFLLFQRQLKHASLSRLMAPAPV